MIHNRFGGEFISHYREFNFLGISLSAANGELTKGSLDALELCKSGVVSELGYRLCIFADTDLNDKVADLKSCLFRRGVRENAYDLDAGVFRIFRNSNTDTLISSRVFAVKLGIFFSRVILGIFIVGYFLLNFLLFQT